jgi:opacity protein-like surface antigen
MHKTMTLAAAVVTAGLASNARAADGLNYTWLEANYLRTRTEVAVLGPTGYSAFDIDGNGFGLRGALRLATHLHAYMEFQKQDFSFDLPVQDQTSHISLGLDTREAGLGVNWALPWNIDVLGRVAYVKADSRVGITEHVLDEDGYALQAGARASVTRRVELEGLAHYVDLRDTGDTLGLRISGRYHFTDLFTAFVGGELDGDTTIWMAGIRVSFPK